MLNRILATAIIAGALSGVFVFGAHIVKVVPLIQAAEVYENAASKSDNHHIKNNKPAKPHRHDAEGWSAGDGLERNLYTLLVDLIMGIGFGLMLTAIIAIQNHGVDWQQGILWGLGGFCAVTAFPALGLAPEMPGMQAANLADRHIWWGATVAASSIGLGLLFFIKNWGLKIVGIILILSPHIVGAPRISLEAGLIPVEIGSEYAATTLIITLFFWIVLGGLTGYFYERFSRP